MDNQTPHCAAHGATYSALPFSFLAGGLAGATVALLLMSVGRAYFDRMAVPIGAALLFVLGVGPALPWGRPTPGQLRRALLPPFVGAALLALVGFLAGVRNPWTLVTLAFGGYALQVTLLEQWLPVRQRLKSGEPFLRALTGAQLGHGRRRFGAYVVHLGMALIVIAIGVSSTMSVQKELQLAPGESAQLGAYQNTFLKTEQRQEPHRTAVVARVALAKNGRDLGQMEPRMNHYDTQREPIGTPACAPSCSRTSTCRCSTSRRPAARSACWPWSTRWWAGFGAPPGSWRWAACWRCGRGARGPRREPPRARGGPAVGAAAGGSPAAQHQPRPALAAEEYVIPQYDPGDPVVVFVVGPTWDFATTYNRSVYPEQDEVNQILWGLVNYRLRISTPYSEASYRQAFSQMVWSMDNVPSGGLTVCDDEGACNRYIRDVCTSQKPSGAVWATYTVRWNSQTSGPCSGYCSYTGFEFARTQEVAPLCNSTHPRVCEDDQPVFGDECAQCMGTPSCKCSKCGGGRPPQPCLALSPTCVGCVCYE